MELGGQARDNAWSLVVRSGHVALPRTQLGRIQRDLGREVSQHPIVFGLEDLQPGAVEGSLVSTEI